MLLLYYLFNFLPRRREKRVLLAAGAGLYFLGIYD